ncbi:MAG TPA: U32 family peptidase, partial [Tepidisphaeraceae bacterium]|nr:U32 family peptidase [Tepidisphaeraceae bacterium]
MADHREIPELLSPAGDWEAMRAAVANGANAVYFGLSNFNARHRATNFTAEQLPEVMSYLHEHNVRGYLALNTLIFSDELHEAAELVKQCAAAGVDAIIVQDLGLTRLIHRMAPTLAIHGSTQMTLTEPRGIEFVKRLGVERVILARELSKAEIQKITAGTVVPVEVFVHGALCVAYSGQCLTSESLGGRSANRGQCAQACRLPYDLVVDGQRRDLGDKAYLLSPQDLAAYDVIGELVNLGVRAFKIEGRLKSAHYVAATTQAYRAALDAAIRHEHFKISPQQQQDLAQSFSRGFTHGFLDGPDHQTLVHARFPKSRGIRLGTVVDKTARGLVVELDPKCTAVPKVGDGVVFDEGHPDQDEQGGRIQAIGRDGRYVELTFYGGDVSLSAVAIGSIVWKTDDPAIRKRLTQSYARDTVAHRIPLHFVVRAALGQTLEIVARDDAGHETRVSWDQPLQKAEKFPLTLELLRDQLGRLGQTPFELGKVELTSSDPVMVPKSVLNDLRRQAAEGIDRQRGRSHLVERAEALGELRSEVKLTIDNCQLSIVNCGPRMTVLARSMDQLRAALDWRDSAGGRVELVYCDFEDVRRYKEAVAMAREAQLPIVLATLRVVKPGEEGLLKVIADCQPDGVLVRNLAAVSYYSQQTPGLAMYGDYSLNVANELTAGVFAEAGLKRLVPSYDLNWKQLEAMLGRFAVGLFEVVIHQHMPMFHMEHCVFAHMLSNGKDCRSCGRPCEKHQVDLRDRVGQAHPLVADAGCRNTLFNAAA